MGPRAKILRLYGRLLEAFGPRGWWPLVHRAGRRGFDQGGYHPGDFDSPRTPKDRLCVSLGAILTQNTSWANADKALKSLDAEGLIDVGALREIDSGRLAAAIRSSGYFTQKARKIKVFADAAAEGRWFSGRRKPERGELLSLWGIGEETADSILLYAFKEPSFVMDSYTLRILSRRGIIEEGVSYGQARSLASSALPARAEDFNECHALFVELAKTSCQKSPRCEACPVKSDCPFRQAGV